MELLFNFCEIFALELHLFLNKYAIIKKKKRKEKENYSICQLINQRGSKIWKCPEHENLIVGSCIRKCYISEMVFYVHPTISLIRSKGLTLTCLTFFWKYLSISLTNENFKTFIICHLVCIVILVFKKSRFPLSIYLRTSQYVSKIWGKYRINLIVS